MHTINIRFNVFFVISAAKNSCTTLVIQGRPAFLTRCLGMQFAIWVEYFEGSWHHITWVATASFLQNQTCRYPHQCNLLNRCHPPHFEQNSSQIVKGNHWSIAAHSDNLFHSTNFTIEITAIWISPIARTIFWSFIRHRWPKLRNIVMDRNLDHLVWVSYKSA